MASLGPNEVREIYGSTETIAAKLYTVKGVDTGDTLDLSGTFRRILRVGFLPVTGTAGASLPTVAAAVLTFAGAGLTDEVGYLLVVGVLV